MDIRQIASCLLLSSTCLAPFSAPASHAADEEQRGWSGRIGGAYAFQNGSGNEDSFRTQINLEEGFVLEDLSLTYGDGKLPDRFTFEARGFGNAFPTEMAKAGFRFNHGIGLFFDYDRRESFFRLAGSDLSLRSDDWEITRLKGRLTIDTWEPLRASVTVRRYERDGVTERPLYALNELYPIGVQLDEGMTEGAFLLETRTLPVSIEFEQSWARYERANRRAPAGDTALNGTDPDLLQEATTDFDDTQEIPTSRLTVSYGSKRFEGLASVLYSDADLDANGAGGTSFAIGGGQIGTIEFMDDLVGSAQSDTLFGTVNLGFIISPSWVLRLSGETRDATTDTSLLGTRLVRSISPAGDALELSAPVDDNGVYDFEDSEGRLRVEFRQPKWSVWGGAFSASRDVSWRQTVDDELFAVDRTSDGGLIGASWTPGRWFDLSAEYEQGDFTRFVFRTDPETVDRALLKLRARLGRGWHIAAHGRYEKARNPVDVAGLDHRSLPYGVVASWASADGSSSAGLDVERMQIETETGLVLPDGEPDLSVYDLDVTSATLYGETTAGIATLRGSATYLDDTGETWPLTSWNAMARLTLRGPARLEYGVFVEYWSYDEDRVDLDDFDVTRGGVSLLWRFR